MSDDDTVPSAPKDSSASADGTMDDGRRYWKAAIAHLAPEKREAAWEFYLDRLESSAAADTLGGVMLLLEAHLAFFDDLPARLGRATQQIEANFRLLGQPREDDGSTASAPQPISVPALRRRWATILIAGVSAASGAAFACVLPFAIPRHDVPTPTLAPMRTGDVLLSRAGLITVSPWSDPATHRRQGAIVSIGHVAWTEQTLGGGASIYVMSPVEEVRHDLDALRQSSK